MTIVPPSDGAPAALAPASAAPPPLWRSWVKLLRLKQWSKNALVLLPVLLSARVLEAAAWGHALLAAFALGLIASAGYILNDTLDRESDRAHPTKRRRPLAAGLIGVPVALFVAAALALAGVGLGLTMGPQVALLLMVYAVGTFLYSSLVKALAVVDVVGLSSLYVLRLGLGIVAARVEPSPWMLVFAFLFFLSLSLAKRAAELMNVGANRRRGYRGADLPFVQGFGLSSALAAIVIQALFLTLDLTKRTQYGLPLALWATLPLLLIFLGRIWLLSGRGQMNEDPVTFALTDRPSLALGALVALTLGVAWLG